MQSKVLLLAGSGEFTPPMETVDSYVLSYADISKRKIAIVPTAAGQEPDYEKWIEMGKGHFEKYGFDAFGVHILNRQDAENKDLVDQLNDASMVYFSGGDPGYLLDSVKDTYLAKTTLSLYADGTVLAGSSAGAWLMGKYLLSNVYAIMKGAETPEWNEALKLVDYTVVPHYNRVTTTEKEVFDHIIKTTPDSIKNNFLGIDEDTALLLTDDKDAMVLGSGAIHVFNGGLETTYKSGSFFTLT